jgi:CheY-like chemotaxis protein
MVIEDSDDDFELLKSSCQAMGLPYVFERQPTGEAGLAALLAAKTTGATPDVVIVDLDLPGLPGYEVIKAIRADPQLRAMVVIVLTGSTASEDQEVCAAADHYLVKPQSLAGWKGIAQLLAASTSRRQEPRTDRAPRLRGKVCHVLHIDDDEDDRLLFARAFARSGLDGVLHSLAGAADALLYLNQLAPHAGAPRPKLIILDLSLPRLDGRELLELLRTNGRFKGIPVIVLTGSENYADMKRCRELGVDDYVVKPGTAQELIELIASFDHWLVGSSTGLPIP